MKEKIVLLVCSTIVLFLSLLSISNSSHRHHLHHNIRRQSLPAAQLHPSPPPIERKYSAIEYDKDMLESVLKEVINDELSKIKGSSGGRGQDPLISASRDLLERLALPPVASARQSEQENSRTTWRPPPPPTTPQPSQFHHAVMIDRDFHARDALLLDNENSVGVKNLVDPSTQKIRAILNEGEKDTTNLNNNHYRDLREELLLLEEKLRHEKSIRQKLEQQEQKLREERLLQERLREEKRKIEQLLAEEKARRENEEAKALKTIEKQRRQQERDEELSSSLPDSSDGLMEPLRVRTLSSPIVGEEEKWISASSDMSASSMDDGSLTPTSMILRHPSSLLAGKEFRPSPFSPIGSFSSPYSSRLPPPFGGPSFGPRGPYFPPPHGPHGLLRARHAIPLSPLGSFQGTRPFTPLAPMIPPIGAHPHHPFASPSSLGPIARYPPPPPPGQQSLHSMAAALYPGLYGSTNQRSSGPISNESDQKEKKNLKSQLVDFAINSILDFGMMNLVGSVLNKINAEPGTR